MNGMLNLIRREVERVMSLFAKPQAGIVTSYDPGTYSAKVMLQPEGTETGFIPIRSIWSGNGWGVFSPPSIGDEVEIQHQEGGKNAPYIALRAFGDKFRPLPAPSGEFWLVHKTGSCIKLHNDGGVEIDSPVKLNINSPLTTITGNVIVNGQIQATEDIIDYYTTNGSTMANFRREYNEHRHNAPDGETSPPLAPDIL